MKTLLCDVDGFICNFSKGAHSLHQKPYNARHPWDFFSPWGLSVKDFYAPMGRDFWANLEPWPDGMEFLKRLESYVGPEHILFLTSPCQTPGCEEGKREWFKKHLPRYDPYLDVMIGGRKQKVAHRDAILLDDNEDNLANFQERGGVGFCIPRHWNWGSCLCDDDGLFHVGNLQQQIVGLLK